MAEKSPKFKLIRNGRGWVKRIGGSPRWVVSAIRCPTGEEADEFYREHFASITDDTEPKPIDRLLLREAFNLFVSAKEGGELHPQTIRDYDDTSLRVLRDVGPDREMRTLTSADAETVMDRLKKLGTARWLKHVVNLRGFIKWCRDPKRGYPMPWAGDEFTAPTKVEQRRDRAKRRKKPYNVREIRRLLQHASDRMRAILLLCLNAAMGPEEVLTLTKADVRKGVIDKPRQKTGVDRRIPLWAETRQAVAGIKTDALFIKRDGSPASPATLIRKFHALCKRAGVPPRGLYTMRRTFRTVADDYGDPRAAALVMGRELPDIDTVYVLTIKDERIVGMLDHVKHVLRIGQALGARRFGQGKNGLAKRIARRAALHAGETSTKSAPTGRNATAPRGASKGRGRKR